MNSSGDKNNNLRVLFKAEMSVQSEKIRAELETLESGAVQEASIDALIRMTQIVKGNAGLAKLDIAHGLAVAMEDFLQAMLNNDSAIDSARVDMMHDAIGVLDRIAEDGVKGTDVDRDREIRITVDEIINGLAGVSGLESADVSAAHKDMPAVSTYLKGEDNDTSQNESGEVPRIRKLFWTEVIGKVEPLTKGLLALEQGRVSQSGLETMMRAAHTIKGGARIAGIEAVTNIAHVMEDIFVAAQSDEISLDSTHVDVLLQGVDIILALAESSSKRAVLEPDELSRAEALIKALKYIYAGKPVEQLYADELTRKVEHSVISDDVAQSERVSSVINRAGYERIVKVNAESMDRIIGLSSELAIEARKIGKVQREVLRIRRGAHEVVSMCDRFGLLIQDSDFSNDVKDEFAVLMYKARNIESAMAKSYETIGDHEMLTTRITQRMSHEALSHRMRPFGEGVDGFARLVRDLSKKLGREVKLEIYGEGTLVDRDILESLHESLMHLIQNAVDHGIESADKRVACGKPATGTIRLDARHKGGRLTIHVEDDGCGIDVNRLRKEVIERRLVMQDMAKKMTDAELFDFILLPNFTLRKNVSTISGRGVGLDVVREMVKNVRGTIHITSSPNKGTRFDISLPITLSVVRCVVFEVAGEIYALPVVRVANCLALSDKDVLTIENREFIHTHDGKDIGLVDTRQILELPDYERKSENFAALIIGESLNHFALVVDRILYETELVERPLHESLGKIIDVSSAAFLEDRTPVLILDADDMMRSIDRVVSGEYLQKISRSSSETVTGRQVRRVLVVDDSVTIREVERNLLSNKGYEVSVAVDGADGWNAVRLNDFDLVVTDIDMPRMDGIELIQLIRKEHRISDIPIIVVSYKDRGEDRDRGLEAGADYYLTKGSFEDNSFVDTVVDLIGEPEL